MNSFGWLPRARVLAIKQGGQVLLMTSLRNLNATVSVGVLPQGLPVVCLDHCGFSPVDDTCGFKVPVVTLAAVIAGLASAIELLTGDDPARAGGFVSGT